MALPNNNLKLIDIPSLWKISFFPFKKEKKILLVSLSLKMLWFFFYDFRGFVFMFLTLGSGMAVIYWLHWIRPLYFLPVNQILVLDWLFSSFDFSALLKNFMTDELCAVFCVRIFANEGLEKEQSCFFTKSTRYQETITRLSSQHLEHLHDRLHDKG